MNISFINNFNFKNNITSPSNNYKQSFMCAHKTGDEFKKSEMENLKFTCFKIKFFPEDEEKMKTMGFDERMDYIDKLRNENRFTVIYASEADNDSSTEAQKEANCIEIEESYL